MISLEPTGRPEDARILASCEEISGRSQDLTPNVREDIENLVAWVRVYHKRLIDMERKLRKVIYEMESKE